MRGAGQVGRRPGECGNRRSRIGWDGPGMLDYERGRLSSDLFDYESATDNGRWKRTTDNEEETTDNGAMTKQPEIAPSRRAHLASRWRYPTAIPSRKSLLFFVFPSLSRISSIASVCDRGERTFPDGGQVVL